MARSALFSTISQWLFGVRFGEGKTGAMNNPYLVPLYGLVSAFLFAPSNHFTNMGLERSNASSGTLVSIATSAVAYWLFAPFSSRAGIGLLLQQ